MLWADALYFRDAAEKGYEAAWSVPLSEQKILKLACLFEIFGLEDCTPEPLLKYRERLAPLIGVEPCLDLIALALEGQQSPYSRYLERFEKKPDSFFPPGSPRYRRGQRTVSAYPALTKTVRIQKNSDPAPARSHVISFSISDRMFGTLECSSNSPFGQRCRINDFLLRPFRVHAPQGDSTAL